MNYSEMSANEQRLHIAANGFQQIVKPDAYLMHQAMQMEDIARDAFRSVDPAKSILRFAVFLKAAKMAYLKPEHIVAWLARSWEGQHALAECPKIGLGMSEVRSRAKGAA